MQLLGCNSEKEVATSNVDARPTVEQQQAAGELEARKQLMAAQTLLEQGNADQAWGLVNQVLLGDAHQCECLASRCRNQAAAG